MNSYYEKIIATGEVKCIDEEIPFEIPNGWEWERVGNIFFVTKLAGFEYTKFFTKEAISAFNPIPIVRAQNVRPAMALTRSLRTSSLMPKSPKLGDANI